MEKSTGISKSLYCAGVQCKRMMWLRKHHPELAEDSASSQSARKTGNEVGALARGLFGAFSLVEYGDLDEMVRKTKELISSGESVIAEASFSYEGLFCSVDILKNLGDNNVELYEVKSSTSVSEIYLHDAAFQMFVLEKCGYRVKKAVLVHIDSSYRRGKELDIQKLFAAEDLTDVVRQMQSEVEQNSAALLACLTQQEEPVVSFQTLCPPRDPCVFWKHCSEHLSSPNVFEIAELNKQKKIELYNQGKVYFDSLRQESKLNPKHEQQIRFELDNLPDYVDTEKIREFLNTLTYPLYFLDFESYQPAIPPYENSWPFEQIPTQYSLHYIERKGARVLHTDFLAEAGKDPRRELAERLCHDIPINVCTLAYNMTFERGRIKELAELYPDLANHLMNIHDNIKDLMIPFRQRQYYSKAMKGSYSIKYVLPALCPNDPKLDYKALEGVHNGSEASAAFVAMEKMSPEEVETCRANLLKYCKLDTYAMVRVLEKLQEAVE